MIVNTYGVDVWYHMNVWHKCMVRMYGCGVRREILDHVHTNFYLS